MKKWGVILLVIGLIIAFYALCMDTTVMVYPFLAKQAPHYLPFQERVYNVGLMQRQRNLLIFGGVLAVIGVVLLGFGIVAGSRTRD